MLDELRDSSNDSEDESTQPPSDPSFNAPSSPSGPSTLFGMTAPQRFILSLMILLMVCVLGAFALIASGSVILPF